MSGRDRATLPAMTAGSEANESRGEELAPGAWVDHYRIKKLLGEGGMGRVYAAIDSVLGRPVALKVIRPELGDHNSLARFLDEARLTAALSHPNIVTIYAIGHSAGITYVALELIEGRTLRQRLQEGPLSEREALRLALSLSLALAKAHRHNVAHFDLKPENVILGSDGRARVVDFGIARALGEDSSPISFGTPGYIPPERARKELGLPADIWALGVVLYECVEGARPTSAQPTWDRARDPELKDLVAACLEDEPTARPRAEEIAARIDRFLGRAESTSEQQDPFRGFASFEPAHAGALAGREREIESAVERLRAQPFLAIVGPSGIGKSSFVKAGLIPRLRETRSAMVIQLRPKESPFFALAARLHSAGLEEIEPLARRLESGAAQLHLCLLDLAERHGQQIVLFVDQLEELYTFEHAAEVRTRFIDALAHAVGDPDEPIRVIVTVRDDYLSRFAETSSIQRRLEGIVLLHALTTEEMREAIIGPIAAIGFTIDDPPALEHMLRELEAQPAPLPLLQFACRALWEKRDVELRRWPASALVGMGGVAGLLAAHGEAVLAGLTERQLAEARTLLLRMVNPDGTRRARPGEEITAGLDVSAAGTLDRLCASRLVAAQRGARDLVTYELAHESLCRAWSRLARWVDESREERIVLAELERAAGPWRERGRRLDETWSSEAIADVRSRLKRLSVVVPDPLEEFLNAGEVRHRRERRRRRGVWAGAFGLLSLIAIGSAVAAVELAEKEREAVAQREVINLAAADIGRFQLVLAPFDLGEDGLSERAVEAASLPELNWELHAPDPADPWRPGPAIQIHRRVEKERREKRIDEVETRSGPAFLRVDGRGRAGEKCGPSWIRLQALPGYLQRDRTPAIELAIPTCRASAFEMIEIPAGPFIYGGPGVPPTSFPEDLEPEREVTLDRFWIDRTEVTNARYRLFAKMEALTGELMPIYPDNALLKNAWKDNYPVTSVNTLSAAAYCRFMGKSLPSLEEWRKAARGGLTLGPGISNPAPRRGYPWLEGQGGRANLARAGDGFDGPAPVGSFPGDRSPYGVMDMSGNVTEWTTSNSPDPTLKRLRALAGGSWDAPAELGHDHLTFSNARDPRFIDFSIGVRCVVR